MVVREVRNVAVRCVSYTSVRL